MDPSNPSLPLHLSRPRYWLNALITLAAFAATCFTIHGLGPMREVPMAKPKLTYFQEHKDDFDLVFIGTSRIFHAVIPDVFDAEMKLQGHPVKSFNLGLDGMTPLETRAILAKVFAMKPARLKWVIIETSLAHLFVRNDLRGLYWHEWRDTAFVCKHLLRKLGEARTAADRKETFFSLVSHLHLYLQHQANLGAGKEWLDKKKWDSYTKRAIAARGYVPLKKPKPLNPQIMAKYHARGTAEGTTPLKDDEASAEVLTDIAKSVEARGIKPIFLRTPTFHAVPNWPVPDSRHVLISFGSMVRFPQLFDISARADPDHLNESGSTELTRLIALEFVKLL